MAKKIFMTDDITRPDDGAGYPVEKDPYELRLKWDDRTFYLYTSCMISYDLNEETLSLADSNLEITGFFFGRLASASQATPTVRMVAQISTNAEFANRSGEITTSEIIGAMRGGNSSGSPYIEIYSRTHPNYNTYNPYSKKLDCLSIATGQGYFYYYTNSVPFNIPLLNYSIHGRQIWIRIKMQRQNGSSWVDCYRYDESTPWRVYTTYTPGSLAVTTPTHFYGNKWNEFTATIPSKYRFEYENILIDESPYLANGRKVVRNPDPPYITEGQETNYLYFYPGLSTSDTHRNKYEFTVNLSIEDPSDSNYRLTVIQRRVSGDIEYLDTDDFSAYGSASWSLTDPPDVDESLRAYNKYNVFLLNVANSIRLTVSIQARYGAYVKTQYGVSRSSTIAYNEMTLDEETQTLKGIVDIPFRNNISPGTTYVGVKVQRAGGGYLLNETLQVPTISYFLPSLPVASIHRCDEDGTSNDQGAYCRIDWAVAITSINNQNSKKLVISHPGGTTTYDPLDSYTQSGSLVIEANIEYSYSISLTVSDDIDETTRNMTLSTAYTVMDWLWNGKGVAFGKVSNQSDAVEISEAWKLICHKLIFSGIDMNNWVKLLESRVNALEQFANNIGSTTQFQVSFYNYEQPNLIKREWVKYGESATAPDENPDREPTETKMYTFVGWSRNERSNAADSNALTNITSNRNIYAAYTTQDRKYVVFYYNDATLLKTVNDLAYHGSASYSGDSPTRDGCVFIGWIPSGRYIESTERAMAQFYENTEITDSWDEIMEAVNDKTALQKYKPGNYKTLSTAIGSFRMRIKGFKIDTYAGSGKKVLISWESAQAIWNHMPLNPPIEYEAEDETVPNWICTTSENYYTFTSNTVNTLNSTYPGIATATVTCKGSGVFRIGYRGYTLYDYTNLTIKLNGETVFSGGATSTMQYLEYPCNNGTVFNIQIEQYCTGTYAREQTVELNWASVANGATITYNITSRIMTRPIRFVVGTGALGGWKECQLRKWLNGDFLNGIDPVVRNNIKSVNKYSKSYASDESVEKKFVVVPNELTYDKVFVPSRAEIYGKDEYENLGVDEWITNGSYRPSDYYWTRTVGNDGGRSIILHEADATHGKSTAAAPARFNQSIDVDNINVSTFFGFCT